MNSRLAKIFILLVIALAIIAVKSYHLQSYLNLAYLQDNLTHFHSFYARHTLQTIGIFAGLYIFCTALSIPGAAVLTLGAGALFGKWMGTLVVSFSSTIGATLAFLIARFFLQDFVQKKFHHRFRDINQGIKKEGGWYLLSLRLVPLFPFFLINLLMGLTSIRTRTFFLISQLGMLPGTFVYVNAGEEISKITTLQGIFTPQILIAFSLLGLFPLLAKKFTAVIKAKKVYRPYHFRKPQSF